MQSHISKISPDMRTSGKILRDKLGYDPYEPRHSASTNAVLRQAVEKLDTEDRNKIKEIVGQFHGQTSPIHNFGENACLELLLKTAMWITESGIEPEQLHKMVETYRFYHPKTKEDKETQYIDLGDYEIGQLIG